MEFPGFGQRRCGRPLMLGVRLQGRREVAAEWERSELALYEFGLRASEVRYPEAPWMPQRSPTSRVEI